MHTKVKFVACLLMTLVLVSCGGGDGVEGGDGNDSGTISYDPIGRYLFDEDSGSIAYNSEYGDLHGEIVGASRIIGKEGNALDFSYVNGSYVIFDICCYGDPDTSEGEIRVSFPNNSFTIAAWLKPSALLMDTIYPIFGGWYGSVQSMKLRINDGSIDFLLYPENNGDPITLITSTSVLENDQWTHVAVTYDGSEAVAYINGKEDNYSEIIMPVEDIINDYFVGGIPTTHSAGGGEYSFPGAIDDFFISENPLSSQEIIELFSIED